MKGVGRWTGGRGIFSSIPLRGILEDGVKIALALTVPEISPILSRIIPCPFPRWSVVRFLRAIRLMKGLVEGFPVMLLALEISPGIADHVPRGFRENSNNSARGGRKNPGEVSN